MESERRRSDLNLTPASPGPPQISEDTSDEAGLHAIIREETGHGKGAGPRRIEREDPSEVNRGEDDGALGLTRTGQDG